MLLCGLLSEALFVSFFQLYTVETIEGSKI